MCILRKGVASLSGIFCSNRLAKLNAASGSALSAGNAAASHDRMELVSQPEDFVKAAVAAAEAVASLAIPSRSLLLLAAVAAFSFAHVFSFF